MENPGRSSAPPGTVRLCLWESLLAPPSCPRRPKPAPRYTWLGPRRGAVACFRELRAGKGRLDLGPSCSCPSTPRYPPRLCPRLCTSNKAAETQACARLCEDPAAPGDGGPPNHPAARALFPGGPDGGAAGTRRRRPRPWRQFRLRIRQWPADPRVPNAVPIATGHARPLIGYVRRLRPAPRRRRPCHVRGSRLGRPAHVTGAECGAAAGLPAALPGVWRP